MQVRRVTLLPDMEFVIISLEFYTKLTLDWFIYAVYFIKVLRGHTSLNYFWARKLYKPSKCQSKCTTIWLANRVSLQTILHSFPLLTVIM